MILQFDGILVDVDKHHFDLVRFLFDNESPPFPEVEWEKRWVLGPDKGNTLGRLPGQS